MYNDSKSIDICDPSKVTISQCVLYDSPHGSRKDFFHETQYYTNNLLLTSDDTLPKSDINIIFCGTASEHLQLNFVYRIHRLNYLNVQNYYNINIYSINLNTAFQLGIVTSFKKLEFTFQSIKLDLILIGIVFTHCD
jgi:hypothetical protein